jgi:predicted ester cyclase
MSVEDNKAIIRAYVEMVWNRKQLDRAEEVVASDFIDHAPLPGQAPGLEGAKRKWAMYLTAIPDLRVTMEDLVAEGDISIFRLVDGKIAENWEQLDRLALLQQLGVIPAPSAPAGPTG